MKTMGLDKLYIDFIEEFESFKLPKTLAMTAFAPTGGGQSKRRAGLRPIGCLKPSNINTFKNLIVMQLGTLSCGKFSLSCSARGRVKNKSSTNKQRKVKTL